MRPSWSIIWRVTLLLFFLSSAIIVCFTMPVDKFFYRFLLWVQNDVGPWGPVLLALAYIPCTVLAIPGSILTLGGGYLFGLFKGFATDCIGATAGATAAFLVGKTVGRTYVTSKLKDYPKFQVVAVAVKKSGFKIVLLLRLVPLLPFNVLNYLLSVTPVSFSSYVLGSWIGMMPVTLALVYVGTTIKDISDIAHGGSEFTPLRWGVLFGGLLSTVVVAIIITRIAQDALKRAVDESESEDAVVLVACEATDADIQSPLVVKIDSPLCEHCSEGSALMGCEVPEVPLLTS